MDIEKERCIAEQAIYGDLKVFYNNFILPYSIDGFRKNTAGFIIYPIHELFSSSYGIIDVIYPILRPMSLIGSEITHKGYNENKPFIPFEKIKEMLLAEDNDFEDSIINTTRVKYAPSEFWFGSMQIIFDFLNMFHFDTRNLITQGEAVSTEKVGDVYAVKQ